MRTNEIIIKDRFVSNWPVGGLRTIIRQRVQSTGTIEKRHKKLWQIIKSKGLENLLCKVCVDLRKFVKKTIKEEREYAGFVESGTGDIVKLETEKAPVSVSGYERPVIKKQQLETIKRHGGIFWHSHPVRCAPSRGDRDLAKENGDYIDLQIIAGTHIPGIVPVEYMHDCNCVKSKKPEQKFTGMTVGIPIHVAAEVFNYYFEYWQYCGKVG